VQAVRRRLWEKIAPQALPQLDVNLS
ncbi:MAG: hypothetical protein AVDCRST_MAG56-552, partial [uncultured Cytophagales bacterium]